jgi:NADH:ubiquinone oxidoreductase subunit 4 (subunit M)
MNKIFVIVSATAAVLTFSSGLITEYRQSRNKGPVAIVATLPMVVASSLFISFSVFGLPLDIPFWGYPIVFIGSCFILGFSISKAKKRPNQQVEPTCPTPGDSVKD